MEWGRGGSSRRDPGAGGGPCATGAAGRCAPARGPGSLGRAAGLLLLCGLLAGCGWMAVPAPRTASGPGAAAPPPAAAPVALPPGTVVVQPGDSLYAIARRNNTPIRAIIDANHLEPPYFLHPGQSLVVPHPEVHLVKAGDTLYGVARQHAVETSELVRVNHLEPPYKILIGQVLILPGQVATASGSTPPAAPAEIQRVEELPPTSVAAASAPVAAAPIEAPSAGAPPPSTPSSTPPALKGIAVVPLPPPLPAAAAPPSGSAAPSSSAAAQATMTPSSPTATTPAPAAAASPPLPPASDPARLESAGEVDGAATAPDAAPDAAPGAAGEPETKLAALPPVPSAAGAANGRLLWPITGRVISGFGAKVGGLFNDGINIAASRGETVSAANDGVVVYAGNEIRGFGNLVLIKHANGWMTAYAHNDKLLVARGQHVTRGQPIAQAGSTGSVSTPQVHFEVRKDSRPVDPLKYLASVSS